MFTLFFLLFAFFFFCFFPPIVFLFFPFCLSIFTHLFLLPVFFGFEILLLIFYLFSFFSNLKNIRTKERDEHKDSFEKAAAMLQQPEAVFFSAQSEADTNSLTQHYFTIRVRGFRNRVPILPVAGL